MNAWHVQDWDVFRLSGRSYDEYKAALICQLGVSCFDEWSANAGRHAAQIPYCVFQSRPSVAMSRLRGMQLPWDRQLMVRSWCRIRAGLVCHRHLDGVRSRAKFQHCIYCDSRVRNATKHTLALCPRWDGLRKSLITGLAESRPDVFCIRLLGLLPGDVLFDGMLCFCHALDAAAHSFWTNKL